MQPPFSRVLIVIGAVMLLVGLIWEFGGRYLNFGRLPGDISVERENIRFYFPIVTCIVLSIVISVLMNVIGKWMGK